MAEEPRPVLWVHEITGRKAYSSDCPGPEWRRALTDIIGHSLDQLRRENDAIQAELDRQEEDEDDD